MLNIIYSMILLTGITYAQGFDELNQFRLAQSYEGIGNYEKALELYRNLYSKFPNQFQYYEGYLKSLAQLKKYDEAINLLKNKLRVNPKDFNLYGEIAVMYSRKDMDDSTDYFINEGIKLEPKNPLAYKFISNILIQNRLFEKSIAVLEQGKKVVNDNLMFSIDLITIYVLLMNYKAASEEMVQLLNVDQNQANFVQTKLAGFINKPDALKTAIEVFEKSVLRDNLAMMRILSWLYFNNKNFSEAFKISQQIDEISKSNGFEILSFADRAYRERELNQAVNAYNYLLKKFPEAKDIKAFSIIGLARSYEELFIDQIKADKNIWKVYRHPLKKPDQFASQSIEYFNIIVKEYNNPNLIAEALFKIARINFEYYFDYGSAAENLKKVVGLYPLSEYYSRSLLILGEIEMIKNNFREAENYFVQLRISPRATENERYLNEYKIAELLILQNMVDSAKSKLIQLSKLTSLDVANDVLELLFIIQENEDNKNDVVSWIKAQQLISSKEFSDATEILKKLSQGDNASNLVNLSRLELADIYILQDDYSNALAQLKYISDLKEKSIFSDRALFKASEIYLHGLKDKEKTVQLLEKLLEEYPQSLLITEARKIIKSLKGSSI